MEIDRPIFILSPHRSGSTLLYRRLGKHPQTGYLNLANRHFPTRPGLARLLTRISPRFLYSDMPREAQDIWDRFHDGDDDVSTAGDATPEVRDFFRGLVGEVLRRRGATRFLAKYPRLSVRLGWLDAIFPDAIFLHLRRRWKAVVGSTVARKRKREQRGGGFFGVRIPGWREWGEEVSHELAAWRQYRFVTKTLEEAGAAYGPDRCFEVRYEDLCERPEAVFRETVAKAGLEWFDEFLEFFPERFACANDKWEDFFSGETLASFRAEDPEFYDRVEGGGI